MSDNLNTLEKQLDFLKIASQAGVKAAASAYAEEVTYGEMQGLEALTQQELASLYNVNQKIANTRLGNAGGAQPQADKIINNSFC